MDLPTAKTGPKRVDGLAELLRSLRLRAGLTQTQLAVALGLGPRYGYSVVSQFERGRRTNPSFQLVLDFLRVCRATPGDLTQLLERYMSVPVEVPARPGAGRPRGPRIPKEDPAVRALREAAALIALRQQLEDVLHVELHEMGVPPGSPVRQSAVVFGRRVFRVLFDARGKEKDNRQGRQDEGMTETDREGRQDRQRDQPGADRGAERGLKRARKSAAARGVPAQAVDGIEARVKGLFGEMAGRGDLDRLPDEAEARRMTTKFRTDAQMCRAEYAARADAAVEEFMRRARPIRAAAERLVIESGVTDNRVGNYRSMVTGFLNVARTTAPGTPERQRKLEQMIGVSLVKGVDEALVRRVADYAVAAWDGQAAESREHGEESLVGHAEAEAEPLKHETQETSEKS